MGVTPTVTESICNGLYIANKCLVLVVVVVGNFFFVIYLEEKWTGGRNILMGCIIK